MRVRVAVWFLARSSTGLCHLLLGLAQLQLLFAACAVTCCSARAAERMLLGFYVCRCSTWPCCLCRTARQKSGDGGGLMCWVCSVDRVAWCPAGCPESCCCPEAVLGVVTFTTAVHAVF
jgi:hypothetical protein